jgi:serine/threonine protein kinase
VFEIPEDIPLEQPDFTYDDSQAEGYYDEPDLAFTSEYHPEDDPTESPPTERPVIDEDALNLPIPDDWAEQNRGNSILKKVTEDDGPPTVVKHSYCSEHQARFVEGLQHQPHPNLLVPLDVSASSEEIWETYPVVNKPTISEAYDALKTALAEGTISVDDIVEVGLQITDALSHMHDQGVIHGDLGAHNVFIGVEERRLHATLFDYGAVMPSDEGILLSELGYDITGLEPSAYSDTRLETLYVGSLLHNLTHTYDPRTCEYTPTTEPDHPLIGVINTAMTPIDTDNEDKQYYADARMMHDALLALRQ